jgi:hypothetical protein
MLSDWIQATWEESLETDQLSNCCQRTAKRQNQDNKIKVRAKTECQKHQGTKKTKQMRKCKKKLKARNLTLTLFQKKTNLSFPKVSRQN